MWKRKNGRERERTGGGWSERALNDDVRSMWLKDKRQKEATGLSPVHLHYFTIFVIIISSSSSVSIRGSVEIGTTLKFFFGKF